MHDTFGQFIKEVRLGKRMTLRDFCRKSGFDPGNVSKVECGEVRPPRDLSILKRYAETLGISEHSDLWTQMLDLSALEHKAIPEDIRLNRMAISRLPMFFPLIRGKKPTEEQMRKIVDLIQNS